MNRQDQYYWLVTFLSGLADRRQLHCIVKTALEEERPAAELLEEKWVREKTRRFAQTDWRKWEDEASRLLEDFRNRSIEMLPLDRREYPAKLKTSLRDAAPAVLFCIGNFKLFLLRSVAIVGSRHCSVKGLDLTTKLSTFFAAEGFNIISGYAKGVDTTAHEAAAKHGNTTIVLPFGILNYRPKKSLRHVLHEGNSLVLSEFKPRQRWFGHAAMQRNKTICALSDAVIVVEAREVGGTLEEGLEALRQRKPLFVIQYGQPPESAKGNQLLIARGGKPLSNWNQITNLAMQLTSDSNLRIPTKASTSLAQSELQFG